MARGSVVRNISHVTGNTSWRARFSYVDDTGRRRHRSKSFRTRKDAEAWLTKVQHELRMGTYIEPSTTTLAEFAEQWFEQARSRLRGSTVHRYQQDWVLYLEPMLGDVQLARIRPQQVQDLYDQLTAKGLSASTVTGAHRVLNSMLKAAVTDELIPTNPCTGRRLPKPTREQATFWTREQLQTFLTYTKDRPTGPLWAFMVATGVRIGEALALQWADVDFERRNVRIHRTVRKDERGLSFAGEGAKTKSSNRTVSMPAMAVMALHRQRGELVEMRWRRGDAWQEQDLVFPNSYGGVKPIGNVHVTFATYVKAAGVPRLSPHGLRHTAASMMLKQGVHPKVAQEQLGHSSISMTLDLYSHLDEGMRRSAADAIDGLMGTFDAGGDGEAVPTLRAVSEGGR